MSAVKESDDKSDQFLGMGFTTSLAIGIVIVCVILAICSYTCCRTCNNSAASSSIGVPRRIVDATTSRDPIIRTIARADAGPEFEVVPVAVAYPEVAPPDNRVGRAYMA